MFITPAKFVFLDTSTLGNAARDFFSSDAHIRRRAHEFLDALTSRGAIPFLSWHQFEELIKHRDDEVASSRVAFLKNLPHVAWLSSSTGEPLGSVFDLLVWECRTILRYPQYSLQQVRDATRNDIIAFGTGRDALKGYEDFWPTLRPQLWARERRRMEIVAIDHAKVPDISHQRVSDFLRGTVRSPNEALAAFTSLQQMMAAAIAERGDRRIPYPENVAKDFYAKLAVEGNAFFTEVSTDPARGLDFFGVSIRDLGPEATMEDFMQLAVFRNKLKVVHGEFNISWSCFKETVPPEKVPSWTIQTALSRHGQTRPEHKGSELNDRYMACLSPYCNLTYVDKQTNEDIRRAQMRSPAMRSIMGTVERVQPYQRIRERIEAGGF